MWNGPDIVLREQRTRRLLLLSQRRAILARDRGCQAPGSIQISRCYATPNGTCEVLTLRVGFDFLSHITKVHGSIIEKCSDILRRYI